MSSYSRWPLLMASIVFASAAVALDLTNGTSLYMVVVLFVMASITLGAFIYAEGARHREWLGNLFGATTEDPSETSDDRG